MAADSYSLKGWETPTRMKDCKSFPGLLALQDSGRLPRVERETCRLPDITVARAMPQRSRHAERPNCMKFFEHSAMALMAERWKIATLPCYSRPCWCMAALGTAPWPLWSPFSKLCAIGHPSESMRRDSWAMGCADMNVCF